MSSTSPSSSASSRSAYFSPDYVTARRRWLEALAPFVESKLVQLHSIPLTATGSTGENLTIDIAVVGNASSSRLLFHSCGVHGVEGYAGSAIQLQFFQTSLSLLALPENTALVFVHAVNAYGMSWKRRWNENNVDLNRNCLSDELWDQIKSQPNADYALFKPITRPDKEPMSWTLSSISNTIYYIARYGYDRCVRSIAGGQYLDPEGLFYGGSQVEEGPAKLINFLSTHFSHAKHYSLIDIHTGLGKSGDDMLIAETDCTPEFLTMLGPHLAKEFGYTTLGSFTACFLRLFSSKPPLHHHSCLGEQGSPENEARRRESTLTVNAVCQEFGTYAGPIVLNALIQENFYNRRNPKDPSHPTRQAVLETFWEQNSAWEHYVLSRGAWLIAETLKHISQLPL